MKLTGEQHIAAPRDRVWAALNDPDVLRQCIPGCQSLDKESDDRMRAVVEVKIGPIGARFNGAVTLSDQHPPESYTITGEGQGGTVGSAKGGARVRLAEDGNGTLLSYDVDAQVGGRLAQLGGPIIDATAKQLAAKFFRQFGQVVAGSAPASAGTVAAGAVTGAAPDRRAASPLVWLLALLAGGLIGYLIGRARTDVGAAEWIGISIGLLVALVAVVAFELGRRTAERRTREGRP